MTSTEGVAAPLHCLCSGPSEARQFTPLPPAFATHRWLPAVRWPPRVPLRSPGWCGKIPRPRPSPQIFQGFSDRRVLRGLGGRWEWPRRRPCPTKPRVLDGPRLHTESAQFHPLLQPGCEEPRRIWGLRPSDGAVCCPRRCVGLAFRRAHDVLQQGRIVLPEGFRFLHVGAGVMRRRQWPTASE